MPTNSSIQNRTSSEAPSTDDTDGADACARLCDVFLGALSGSTCAFVQTVRETPAYAQDRPIVATTRPAPMQLPPVERRPPEARDTSAPPPAVVVYEFPRLELPSNGPIGAFMVVKEGVIQDVIWNPRGPETWASHVLRAVRQNLPNKTSIVKARIHVLKHVAESLGMDEHSSGQAKKKDLVEFVTRRIHA